MGLMDRLFSLFFGAGRNVLSETVEVFRENAEAGAARDHSLREQALVQFATEFARRQRSPFDRFMDAMNRIPRPAMALGTLGLFVAAMIDPVWFASRMQGITLVPEPLWWLLGAIVSFYFGARHQTKGQEFQTQMAAIMARVPLVMDNLDRLHGMDAGSPQSADPATDTRASQLSISPDSNAALNEWRASKP